MISDTVTLFVASTGGGGDGARVGAGVDRAEAGFLTIGLGGIRIWTWYPISPSKSTSAADLPSDFVETSLNLGGQS